MAGTATATVCSMCGDIGFPDKLFQCVRCRYRFQHSYCTNYYGDGAPASAGSAMCDWCLSELAGKARSTYSSAAAKQQDAGSQESCTTISSAGRGGKASAGEQESGRRGTKAAGRRYKLLKDVLC
ncbi:hypothetical protein GUJ93_ZPchr0004g39969 [Zizania palustris]|uniref:PHD-type zinc finger plants domain-containing protein n=1 Tax=Zizania palustris TaxID=103762 RepID=A0A8J5SCV1_ZIZPA|nr:hypothetical protein GUJ93_ZPchr0004g39969 [Zizania palustris]